MARRETSDIPPILHHLDGGRGSVMDVRSVVVLEPVPWYGLRMKRLLVLACLVVAARTADAQSLVLTNARILDGKGGVIERGAIVVRDGRIASVAAGAADAPGVRVIDVKGMTVMPGFIDSHRHPIGQGADWLKTEAPARMQEFLDAGFTTVLSAGDDPAVATALRDQIAKGAIKGPRLIVLGRAPTAGPAGGAGRGAAAAPAGRGGGAGRGGDPARNLALRLPPPTAAAAVPPDQTRATVERLAKAGVDGIKTVIQVSPNGPETATLTLIVQEAKKFNLPVITHAVSVADTLAAVQAGVQSLAHTPHIDQLTLAQAQTIAKSGIPMISTLGVFVPYFDAANTPLFRDRLAFPWETLPSAGNGPVNARLVAEAGTTYGYGTDTSWLPRESLALELRPLALTFSPKDIVSILTRNAAAAILKTDRGSLEPGTLADIVVLNGDPLVDPQNLLKVSLVVKGGEVVVERP
jgi:imidazolonepropionase-like amidohydrolase